MKKIDLHTHQITEEEYIQVLNVFAQNLPFSENGQLFSTGLHPWHIKNVKQQEYLQAIETAMRQKNMIALGECGLDRSIAKDISNQLSYFEEQIRLAENFSKPLIIHCVRAYPDLIKLKKDLKSDLPWIIHGYCGNLETTRSLIRHGFYFSVGESLLKDERKRASFLEIPIDRLFLETDDKEVSIQYIYSIASQLLTADEEMITDAIYSNFKTVFGNDKP